MWGSTMDRYVFLIHKVSLNCDPTYSYADSDFPSLALPEIRPDPLLTVPFSRDPDFISRDGLISRMDEKASMAGSRLALVGLGGVGLE